MRIRIPILVSVIALAATIGLAPREASAQVRLGPHLGASFDHDALFIGMDVWVELVDITSTIDLHLDPAFSFYFTDDHYTLFSFDVNVPFLFALKGTDVVAPYAAPGLAIRHARWDWDYHPRWEREWHDSDTDLGLNLIGGAMFIPERRVNPFAQLKITVGGGSDFALMGGVLFQI